MPPEMSVRPPPSPQEQTVEGKTQQKEDRANYMPWVRKLSQTVEIWVSETPISPISKMLILPISETLTGAMGT